MVVIFINIIIQKVIIIIIINIIIITVYIGLSNIISIVIIESASLVSLKGINITIIIVFLLCYLLRPLSSSLSRSMSTT